MLNWLFRFLESDSQWKEPKSFSFIFANKVKIGMYVEILHQDAEITAEGGIVPVLTGIGGKVVEIQKGRIKNGRPLIFLKIEHFAGGRYNVWILENKKIKILPENERIF